jgi:hypothetical protein
MSVITFQYSPVLTPKLIHSLDGKLREDQREELLKALNAAIRSCFKPFARKRGRPSDLEMEQTLHYYLPHRVLLVEHLMRILSHESFVALLDATIDLLKGWDDWETLGLSTRSIQVAVEQYAKSVRKLLGNMARLEGWGRGNSPALLRLVDGWIWSATDLDYTLTSLFLCKEGELEYSRPRLHWLMRHAGLSSSRYAAHIDALCREPQSLDHYFFQLLAERGLFVMATEEPSLQRPPGFEPVPIRGEPASVTLIRDRR